VGQLGSLCESDSNAEPPPAKRFKWPSTNQLVEVNQYAKTLTDSIDLFEGNMAALLGVYKVDDGKADAETKSWWVRFYYCDAWDAKLQRISLTTATERKLDVTKPPFLCTYTHGESKKKKKSTYFAGHFENIADEDLDAFYASIPKRYLGIVQRESIPYAPESQPDEM
jgi:hypothetical protein